MRQKNNLINHVLLSLISLLGCSVTWAGAAENPCDPILKSMQTQIAGKAYRTRTTIVDTATGKSLQLAGEFVPPDRVHLMTEREETIVILKQGTFMKPKNGAWKKSPFDMSQMLVSFTDLKIIEHLSKDFVKSDCKQIGSESLEGKQTQIYQYKITGPNLTSIAKVWIGVADGLPYKQQIEGDAGGHKSKTTQLIEYDPAIKIEAPTQPQ